MVYCKHVLSHLSVCSPPGLAQFLLQMQDAKPTVKYHPPKLPLPSGESIPRRNPSKRCCCNTTVLRTLGKTKPKRSASISGKKQGEGRPALHCQSSRPGKTAALVTLATASLWFYTCVQAHALGAPYPVVTPAAVLQVWECRK